MTKFCKGSLFQCKNNKAGKVADAIPQLAAAPRDG